MTVYVVERVALEIHDWKKPATLTACGGEAGASWVPVSAFAREADATADAARRTISDRDWFCPAHLLGYDGYGHVDVSARLAAVMLRHGLPTPEWKEEPSAVLRQWWASQAAVPPEVVRGFWTVIGDYWQLYRVEARTLED